MFKQNYNQTRYINSNKSHENLIVNLATEVTGIICNLQMTI